MIKIELLNNGLYDSTFIFENNQLITEDAPIGSRGDKTKIYYIKKYANNKGFKKSFYDYCMTLKNKVVKY